MSAVNVEGRRETELEAEIRQWLEDVNPSYPAYLYVNELLKRAYNALRAKV